MVILLQTSALILSKNNPNSTLSLQERNLVQPPSNVLSPDLKTVDLSFGPHLSTLPMPHCYAFETRKVVDQSLPDVRDIVKIKGLVAKCTEWWTTREYLPLTRVAVMSKLFLV